METQPEISRSEYVKRNILFSYLGNAVNLILSFVSRTAFIYFLDTVYLGVNGLFGNVLGILSFTELGIGGAMNYSLYRPIADGDEARIKSLMGLYKRAYRAVAVVISALGLLLLPFIDRLVSAEAQFDQLRLYYLIFLFNTVSSYFVSYKYAYVGARQEGYILTNIDTVASIVGHILAIFSLYAFRSFLAYLLCNTVFGVLQKLVTVLIVNRRYPILREKNPPPVSKEDEAQIRKNVKALIIHKVGDASVHQTDSLIISVFYNTVSVGLLSNYAMLTKAVNGFVSAIFSSFTAGFGNLVAKEPLKKQRTILEAYNFLGYWLYGFVLVAFVTLSQPFLELWERWAGKAMRVDDLTVILYFVSLYLGGQSYTVYVFKIAAGIFSEDKWFSLIQSVVNLTVSIAAIRAIGLPGIYVGTIVSRMVIIISRPYVTYKTHFNEYPVDYFLKFLYNSATIALICFVMRRLSRAVLPVVTIPRFALMVCLTAVIPNLLLLLFNFWRPELRFAVDRAKRLLKRGGGKRS